MVSCLSPLQYYNENNQREKVARIVPYSARGDEPETPKDPLDLMLTFNPCEKSKAVENWVKQCETERRRSALEMLKRDEEAKGKVHRGNKEKVLGCED